MDKSSEKLIHQCENANYLSYWILEECTVGIHRRRKMSQINILLFHRYVAVAEPVNMDTEWTVITIFYSLLNLDIQNHWMILADLKDQ